MRVAAGIAVGALLLVGTTTTFAQPTTGGTAELRSPTDEMVGSAAFTEASGGVNVRVQVRGLPSGAHGIHVHEMGKCEAPDFMSAGGHYNPTARQHGLQNPQGAHGGDQPNLNVGPDGSATFDGMLMGVTLGSGTGSLFKTDGAALVIHANADDQMTDPSGNSGGRIACGVIARMAGSPQAAPAAQPSPAAKPAAPAQAPMPAALPRTGSASPLANTAVPAALAGAMALVGGFALWRRRR